MSFDDDFDEAHLSDSENYLRPFAGCSIASLRGETRKKIRSRFTRPSKTIVLSHAVTYLYAAHALPSIDLFLHLAHLLQLPTGYGARVTEKSLELLFSLLQRLTSSAGTHNLIRAIPTGHQAYRVEISSVLKEAIDISTQTEPHFVTSFNTDELKYGWSSLPARQVTGQLYQEVPNSEVTAAELLRGCMEQLVRTGQINHSGTSTVHNPFQPIASGLPLSFLPPARDNRQSLLYAAPTNIMAPRDAQEIAYEAFVRWMDNTSLDMMAGMTTERQRYMNLWAWNHETMDMVTGVDYTNWTRV